MPALTTAHRNRARYTFRRIKRIKIRYVTKQETNDNNDDFDPFCRSIPVAYSDILNEKGSSV